VARALFIENPSDDIHLSGRPSGALRIGESRVLLELVIRAFAVIAYYLRHRAEVEAYLTQRE
jgi:hypothetical protein